MSFVSFPCHSSSWSSFPHNEVALIGKKKEEHIMITLEKLPWWYHTMIFQWTDNKCLLLLHHLMHLCFITAQQIVSNAQGDTSDWQHQQGCTQCLSLLWPLNGILCCQKNTELLSSWHTPPVLMIMENYIRCVMQTLYLLTWSPYQSRTFISHISVHDMGSPWHH